MYPYIQQYHSHEPMERFVKCFFKLLTQALISAAGNGTGKGGAKRACGRLEAVFTGT